MADEEERTVSTSLGEIPASEFKGVVRTPQGAITREEYENLQAKFPEGIPSSAIEELVMTRPEPQTAYEKKFEEAQQQKITESITDLQKLTPEQYETYQKLSPDEQTQLAIKTGALPSDAVKITTPEGAAYVTKADVDAAITNLQEQGIITESYANILRNTATSSAYATIQAKIEEAQEQQKEGLLKSWVELTGADEKQQKAMRKEIEEKGVETIYQYLTEYAQPKIEKEQLKDFEEQLKSLPVELQEAYKTGGVDAYNKAVEVYNAKIAEQREALGELKGFVVTTEYPWEGQRIPETGYDLPSAIQAGVTEETLLKAGFTVANIEKANEYLKKVEAQLPNLTTDDMFKMMNVQQQQDLLRNEGVLSYKAGWSPELMFAHYDIPLTTQQELKQYNVRTMADFNKLPDDTKATIMSSIWASLPDSRKKSLFETQTRGQIYAVIAQNVVLGAVPVVGTVALWNEMPLWAKAVSITGDLLFFASLSSASSLIKAFRADKLVDTATASRVIASNVDDTVKVLGGINPKLLEPFQNVVSATTKYADDFYRLRAAQATIAQADDILRSGSIARGTTQYQALVDLIAQNTDDVSRLSKIVLKGRTQLLNSLGKYTDDLIEVINPKNTDLLNSLKQIPQKTLSNIENLMPSTTNLATLKAELLVKQNALLALQKKYPLDASKWMDVIGDISELEAKITLVSTSNVSELYSRLLMARQAIPQLEATLKTLRSGSFQYNKIARQLASLKQVADDLPKQIDDAIRLMQVEWTKGAYWTGGGRTPVLTSPALSTIGEIASSVELTKTGQLPFLSAVAPIFSGISGVGVETGVTPLTTTPSVISPIVPSTVPTPIPDTIIQEIISPQISPISDFSPEMIPSASIVPEIATGAGEAIAPAVNIAPSPAPAPSPATSSPIATRVSVATRLFTPETIQETTPSTPPIIPFPEGGGREIMQLVPVAQGAIVFKMGFLWKSLPPPWLQDKLTTLKKGEVPAGADTSGRTPEETIQVIGEPPYEVPETISIDLGVVDAEIYNYGKNIRFSYGLYTDVGESLESPTVGLSIPSVFEDKRPVVRRKAYKPIKRNNNFKDLVSMKGVRL